MNKEQIKELVVSMVEEALASETVDYFGLESIEEGYRNITEIDIRMNDANYRRKGRPAITDDGTVIDNSMVLNDKGDMVAISTPSGIKIINYIQSEGVVRAFDLEKRLLKPLMRG